MTIEETIAAAVEAKVRPLLEEMRALLASVTPAAAADGYLSVEKAAELAEVHGDTIRNWVKAGKLPEHRAGRELRVRRDELHRFLGASTQANTRPTVEEEAAGILAGQRK